MGKTRHVTYRHVTYRHGKNNHFPREINGSEVNETTEMNFAAWLEEHEIKIGPVSILWFGSRPMPEKFMEN